MRGKKIVFDLSKGEKSENFEDILKYLYSRGCECVFNSDIISKTALTSCTHLLIAGPKKLFSFTEFNELKEFVRDGKSILIFHGGGGDLEASTNINYFLEEFGIVVNSDHVVRAVPKVPYFHPKKAYILDGFISSNLERILCERDNTARLRNYDETKTAPQRKVQEPRLTFPFVFPNGASLRFQEPAFPILSSGVACIPSNRPIAAARIIIDGARLMVVGSVEFFHDSYSSVEKNQNIKELMLDWWIEAYDKDSLIPSTKEITCINSNYEMIDNTSLAENLRPCFQFPEPVPSDFASLFDSELFEMNFDLLPDLMDLYEKLGLDYEPLQQIFPKFQLPLPNFVPATFAALPPNLPAPQLEFFDLEEEFTTVETKLCNLRKKCSDSNLMYFIFKAAKILEIPCGEVGDSDILEIEREAKKIMLQVFSKIFLFKRKHSFDFFQVKLR